MKGVQSVTADKERILIKKIDPILLFVSDFSKCLSFYRNALGMTLRTQVGEFAELDAGGITLALHGTADMEWPRARTQEAPVVLHFVAKDMDRLRASLEAWGTSFSQEPEEIERRGATILQARFLDPDGNEMRVNQDL